ncbi:MAG: hypothetical protein ACFFAS_15575 [Promethearchaeota archaeon]
MGLLDTKGKRSSFCAIGAILGVLVMVLFLFITAGDDMASLGQPTPQGEALQPLLITGGVLFFVVMILFYILIMVIDWKRGK